MHEELRQLRDLTGRSLRELARDIHVSSSSLSRYFSGQAVPPWSTVVALCKAAGRDPRPLRALWDAAKEGPEPAATVAPARNDLPHDVSFFTGRRAELRELLDTARNGWLVAIDGMGGVGKSTLAVHAAHLLTGDFPGGQLYLDLHGFTPGRDRVEPAEALRVLLTAIGVPPGRIPGEPGERAALWRAQLAPRRALVLLDNAADEDHVRELLPGAGDSTAVITSRRRMVDLDGVHPISLDVMPAGEAAQLFTEAAGGPRPGDVGEVLRRCGNLPLAIRVAGARLRHRPAWTIDTLVERLREGELAIADVFTMSLRQLDPAQRRMFGLLGLVPGEDVDAYSAAALAGIPLGNARALLEDLVDVHLVEEPAAGRYRMHDLLRQVARADADATDAVAAVTRLGDYYLHGLLEARRMLEVIHPQPVVASQPPPALPDLSGYDLAVDWMDTEWINLTAMFGLAVDQGIDPLAVGLAQLASSSHARHGSVSELSRWTERSMPAAVRLGNRRVLAFHRYLLGAVSWRSGRIEQALPELEAARELTAAEGDLSGEVLALVELAEVRARLGDIDESVVTLQRAVALQPPDEAVRVRANARLGITLVRLERYREAQETVAEVIEVAHGLDRQTLRMCLDVLTAAALGLGDAAGSMGFAEQALALNRATRNPSFEAATLVDIAVALRHLGRDGEADERLGEAIRILEHAGEPYWVVGSFRKYAQACLATGDPDAAERNERAADEVAAEHDLSQASRPVPGQ